MSPTLVLMAAGLGSRYGGLKQVDAVGPHGECIMDYSVFDAVQAGFSKAVFIIRRDMEDAFKCTVGARFRDQVDVQYAFQERDMIPAPFSAPPERRKPWGTGHALLCAEPLIEGPFAVINADDFYGRHGFQLLHRHLSAQSDTSTDYALVGYKLRNTLSDFGSVSRGVCHCDDDGYLISVEEYTALRPRDGGAVDEPKGCAPQHFSGDEWVSMNLWGFTRTFFAPLRAAFTEFLATSILDSTAEIYIPNAVERVIREKAGRTKILPSRDSWFGVTYPEDKPHVVASIRALIARGVYPERLGSSV